MTDGRLKPCPFCKSNQVSIKMDGGSYYTTCKKCKFRSPNEFSELWAIQIYNDIKTPHHLED
jgi:transcription elongation factor Elf1